MNLFDYLAQLVLEDVISHGEARAFTSLVEGNMDDELSSLKAAKVAEILGKNIPQGAEWGPEDPGKLISAGFKAQTGIPIDPDESDVVTRVTGKSPGELHKKGSMKVRYEQDPIKLGGEAVKSAHFEGKTGGTLLDSVAAEAQEDEFEGSMSTRAGKSDPLSGWEKLRDLKTGRRRSPEGERLLRAFQKANIKSADDLEGFMSWAKRNHSKRAVTTLEQALRGSASTDTRSARAHLWKGGKINPAIAGNLGTFNELAGRALPARQSTGGEYSVGDVKPKIPERKAGENPLMSRLRRGRPSRPPAASPVVPVQQPAPRQPVAPQQKRIGFKPSAVDMMRRSSGRYGYGDPSLLQGIVPMADKGTPPDMVPSDPTKSVLEKAQAASGRRGPLWLGTRSSYPPAVGQPQGGGRPLFLESTPRPQYGPPPPMGGGMGGGVPPKGPGTATGSPGNPPGPMYKNFSMKNEAPGSTSGGKSGFKNILKGVGKGGWGLAKNMAGGAAMMLALQGIMNLFSDDEDEQMGFAPGQVGAMNRLQEALKYGAMEGGMLPTMSQQYGNLMNTALQGRLAAIMQNPTVSEAQVNPVNAASMGPGPKPRRMNPALQGLMSGQLDLNPENQGIRDPTQGLLAAWLLGNAEMAGTTPNNQAAPNLGYSPMALQHIMRGAYG